MSADSDTSHDPTRDGSGNEPYRTQFDPEREDASAVIVEAIAAIEGTDPRDVGPLYPDIDPDALDVLVRSTPEEGPATITITVKGYEVAIDSRGAIVVHR